MVSGFIKNIKGKAIGGILIVVLGNVALLFSKTVIWLLVPGMLGVVEYGYYKTFTLYFVYAMLLHFGFPDGILLIHAGQRYEEIDKAEFRRNSRFFIIFQMLVSLVITGMSLMVCRGISRYIFCMIGIDALFVNVATYYKFISQAVMRFRELTVRNMIQAVLQVASLLVILVLSKNRVLPANGYVYIFSVVMIDAVLMIWYMITYKDITFGRAVSLLEHAGKIRKYFSVGILLTLAFQVSHLVFALDSQMVEILFEVEIYSLYAFSYSITNMITTVISAVATVLLPSLKRLEERDALSKFSDIMGMVSIVVFFFIAAYYPLVLFVRWYLPDYVGALRYLRIILPGLAVSSCINLVIFTYYKVLNCLRRYLFVSIVMLFAGGILNCGGYLLFHTPESFSAASIITLLLWYLLAEYYLVKAFQAGWLRNFIYICLEITIFYVVNIWAQSELKAMCLYCAGYFISTLPFYKKLVRSYKL